MRYWKVYGTVIGLEDAFSITASETIPQEPDEFLPDVHCEEINKEEYERLHHLMYDFSPTMID